MDSNAIASTLVIPAHMDFFPVAMNFIEHVCKSFNLDKEDSLKIRLGFEESVKNVIEHGYENDIGESFSITVYNMPDRVEVVIKEKGKPYDPEGEKDKEGYGILLIKSIMDESYFKNLGREGKETRLVKYKSSGKIDNLLKLKKKHEIVKENVKFIDRGFRDSDALEISKCAYYAYGYSYEPFIYYPSQIKRLNKEGTLMSFVSVTENGEVATHLALKFIHGTACPELGVGFSNPKFRGRGLFTNLTEFAVNQAFSKEEIKAVYVKAVTVYTMSQNVTLNLGFFSCAILLAMFPQDANFKSLIGEAGVKIAALLMCLIKESPEKRVIFPPDKHKEIIDYILSDSLIDIAVSKSNEFDLPEKGSFVLKKNDVLNIADIYLYGYGKDSKNEILRITRKLLAKKIDAIYLHLNLEHPFTSEFSSFCEYEGFIFGGVLPFGLNGNHSLILQYVNTEVDLDKIKLASEKGKRILKYISKFIKT